MTFHCDSCGHEALHFDHEVVRGPDGRRVRVSRIDPRFWESVGLTRDEAVAQRRLGRVSPWLCLDRDCGCIVEHERTVLPGVLGWWAGAAGAAALVIGTVGAIVGPLVVEGVSRRHVLTLAAAGAVVLWVVGMALAATFSEALGRWRFRADWAPVRPERCTHCGSRRLEPLILPRRARQAAGRRKSGAMGIACPRCRERAMWYVGRWVV